MLVYNLVQQVINEADRRQGVVPERISFVDAVRWITTAGLMDDLPALIVNPVRLGRFEPRVRQATPRRIQLYGQAKSGTQGDDRTRGEHRMQVIFELKLMAFVDVTFSRPFPFDKCGFLPFRPIIAVPVRHLNKNRASVSGSH